MAVSLGVANTGEDNLSVATVARSLIGKGCRKAIKEEVETAMTGTLYCNVATKFIREMES